MRKSIKNSCWAVCCISFHLNATRHLLYLLLQFFIIQSLFSERVQAQVIYDTLKEIKVIGKQKPSSDIRLNNFSPGLKLKTIDSQTLQQYKFENMANLLTQQLSVFVKSYGFNSLATLNFRGSSSAQNIVLWNGVPLQNSSLGIADISTLPVLFISKVNIVYGGSSALWGSGNVGGALLIESNAPTFDSCKKTLSLLAGAGSFGLYMYGLKADFTLRKWYFSANLFSQTAINNFPYTTQTDINDNMANCGLNSNSIILNAAHKVNEKNSIGLSAWYQQYDREIPPATFEPFSDKKQIDKTLRILLDWKRQTFNNTWYAKFSLNHDDINYDDSLVNIHSRSFSIQYYQEVGYKHQFKNLGQLMLFVPIQFSYTNFPLSNDLVYQKKVAVAFAYNIKLLNNNIDLAINARQEVIQLSTNQTSIFLPGANANYSLTQWLSFRANVQHTYRAPTLNELYYYPGGNINLKPEQGWAEDAGYTIKLKLGRFNLYHDVSLFNREINDWILWLGGAVWTPHNIAEVNSRGAETENNLEYVNGNLKFHLGLSTSYVLATTIASYIPNDGSIGKQIPYTPRYNGIMNIGLSYFRFKINYNHTYTGYRFMTTDQSEYLLPYQTGNVQLMYNTNIFRHNVQITAQCNNVWNNKYQVVAYRPMPGINWLLGCKFDVW